MGNFDIEQFNEFMGRIHYERIPIKNLVSNQDYQRALSDLHVKRAVENFDPYQINPVRSAGEMELIMFLMGSIQLK